MAVQPLLGMPLALSGCRCAPPQCRFVVFAELCLMRRLDLIRVLCGSAFLLGAVPASGQEKLTFLIDWLPAGDKAVPYLGVKGGFFAAEGLDVTIQSARGSSEVVTRLATGVADLGIGGIAAVFQAHASGAVPIKAVIGSLPAN
jgi:NitT/TauT family transport system substrate-binding protein